MSAAEAGGGTDGDDPVVAPGFDGDDDASEPGNAAGAAGGGAESSAQRAGTDYSAAFKKAKDGTTKTVRQLWREFHDLPFPAGLRRSGAVVLFFPPTGKPAAITTFPGDNLASRHILGLAASAIDSYLNKPTDTLQARKSGDLSRFKFCTRPYPAAYALCRRWWTPWGWTRTLALSRRAC